MQKNNPMALLIIYLGLSALFFIMSRDDGTIPVWIFQALIGPLWHLSASVAIIKRALVSLDGSGLLNKNFLTGLASVFIWVFSGTIIVLWSWVEKKYVKIIFLISIIIIWLLVAYLNIILYGLFTV